MSEKPADQVKEPRDPREELHKAIVSKFDGKKPDELMKACLIGLVDMERRQKEKDEQQYSLCLDAALTLPFCALNSFLKDFESRVDDSDYSFFLTSQVLSRAIHDRMIEIAGEVQKRTGPIMIYMRKHDVNRPTEYELIEDVRIEQPAKSEEKPAESEVAA